MPERADVDADFNVPRLPPLRPLSPLVARARAGAIGAAGVPWEELAVSLAVRTVRLAAGATSNQDGLPLNAEARVSRSRPGDRSPSRRGAVARNVWREKRVSARTISSARSNV